MPGYTARWPSAKVIALVIGCYAIAGLGVVGAILLLASL